MTKSSALVLSVAVLLQLHAQPGRAQTSTGDAIDAFVRGDYQRAAEILTPITNRWPGLVDAAANFFMAGLYENGLGVPRDPVRACALYFRSGPEGLFGGMNLGTMLPRLQRTLTTNQAGECTLLMMFLPIEHTALAVRGVAPGTRHFIQIPTWQPEPSLNEWHLVWSLFEVVRDDVVTITSEVVAIAPGHMRPVDPRVDLSKLVALRVNLDGNAEWAVLTGRDARSGVIEPDVERQDVRTQKEVRKAAEERVDWNQVRSAALNPSFAYSDAEGCGSMHVFGCRAACVLAGRAPQQPFR